MQEKTIEKVRNFISSNQMLQNGILVIAGVSGGADSMTMLDILWKLREETGFSLQAVHVNHGIRGEEADRDEKIVEAFCKEQGFLSRYTDMMFPHCPGNGKWDMKKPDGRYVRKLLPQKRQRTVRRDTDGWLQLWHIIRMIWQKL